MKVDLNMKILLSNVLDVMIQLKAIQIIAKFVILVAGVTKSFLSGADQASGCRSYISHNATEWYL